MRISKLHGLVPLALLGSAFSMSPLSAGTPSPDPLLGRWWNSDGTVAVDVAPCAAFVCGKVVHAEKGQQEKARRAGVAQMLGLVVMRDFARVSPRKWKGIAFVPERNRSVQANITAVASDRVKVEGCIFVILCRHEIWRRNR